MTAAAASGCSSKAARQPTIVVRHRPAGLGVVSDDVGWVTAGGMDPAAHTATGCLQLVPEPTAADPAWGQLIQRQTGSKAPKRNGREGQAWGQWNPNRTLPIPWPDHCGTDSVLS